MRIFTQQFDTQITRPALHQVWIWVHRPDGAHLEARWIDDSQPTSFEANDNAEEIDACLQALESAL